MSNVLIVDDVPDITHMMSVLLQLRGHRTVEACTGRQAIALMTQRPFDAFLIDIILPDINGIEVARAVRRRYGQKPKVLAVTGWGHRDMRARCLSEGFDYHVLKPVDGRRLIGLIEREKS
jgi:CheY-like chemotaxis protein